MAVNKKDRIRSKRRKLRVSGKIKKVSLLPRVSIFRSLNHIYAQIIDDNLQKTLVSCSSLEMSKLTGKKTEVAYAVGKELAKRAQQQNVTAAVFDRGRFLYHGRVRAVAEGLREGGFSI